MWITVICQWLNIIFGNIGLTILGEPSSICICFELACRCCAVLTSFACSYRVASRAVLFRTRLLTWAAANAGGQALKGMHDLYNDNQNIKLADWMIVAGACNGIFALAIPNLHGLRIWSGIACACTIIFVVIVVGIAAYDGESTVALWG